MNNKTLRAWAEVDLDAIKHNFLEVKNATASAVCCVVKSNAYGHGAVALARVYEELGADFFAVATFDEAMELRENNINSPILILGYTAPCCAKELSLHNISQCVYSLEYGKMLNEECVKGNVSVNVHIKIDTGMSRIGFVYQDKIRDISTIEKIKELYSLGNLCFEGIFTHFSESDSEDTSYTKFQLDNFNDVISKLSDIKFKYKHCANSASIINFPNTHFDMIRAGIILYGLKPCEENLLDLVPALSLKAVVIQVKHSESETYISYGRTYKTCDKCKIATVAIGYGDGYARNLCTKDTCVLINGKRRKVIGRICMDQLMVLLEEDDDVKIGDVAVLIGKDGNEFISADEIAKKLDTINYEIICDISPRVKRIYK